MDADAVFEGLGGEKMHANGCKLVQDYKKMAFMGFEAVLRNIFQVRKNFQLTYEALLQFQPDALILIDYPSFNLRVASWCKKYLPQTKIVYYIPPKVWAWKTYRVHKIAKLCDLVLGIFPFEVDFYKKYGYQCEYVGNPVVETINEWQQTHGSIARTNTIALLPGSRMSEITHCLPVMLAAARKAKLPDEQIVVTSAPEVDPSVYEKFLQADEKLTNETYKAVSQAKFAIVNSGTATLETALLDTPQMAVYYTEYQILVKLFRSIVMKLSLLTLVNIILQKEVIQELIADRFTEENIIREIKQMRNVDYQEDMKKNYHLIRSILTEKQPSQIATKKILEIL